jgi:hypothetical protein
VYVPILSMMTLHLRIVLIVLINVQHAKQIKITVSFAKEIELLPQVVHVKIITLMISPQKIVRFVLINAPPAKPTRQIVFFVEEIE